MFRKVTLFCKDNSGKVLVSLVFGITAKSIYDEKIKFFEPIKAFSLFPAKIELKDALTKPITNEEELKSKDIMRYRMEAYITNLQGKIIKQLQSLEPDAKFTVDRWERPEGGGGITCIVQDGSTFERAAVNISVVSGVLPPSAAAQMRSRGRKEIPTDRNVKFSACGISCVIHPRNPYVPTLHFNYRYFEIETEPGKYIWWFGGGTDLTPYYLDENDVKHFHKTLKTACDKNSSSYYTEFKKWCDNYFFISHRNECRGVGGIFFDDLEKPNQEKVFEFVKTCGDAVLPGYIPIVKKNMNKGYGLDERNWQLLRRGRYVEFNLVHDRGTKFGLATPGARTESILVSLPLVAKWDYKHEPKPNSPEAALMEVLKKPRDWLNE